LVAADPRKCLVEAEIMRIAKQDDGWWIFDVPSSQTSGKRFTSCGPYRTKAEAADDRLGLERFFREHPVLENFLPGFPRRRTVSTCRANHWLAKSLEFKPPRLIKPKRFKYSPRQMTLPGFDLA
jgi:hypothetical protein